MTLKDLVVSYLDTHNLSQREFARLCGVTNSSISLLIKGTNPKTGEPIKQTLDTLKKYAAGMGMTSNELALEADDIDIELSFDALPDNILPMPKMKKIPLLGTIACGEPILAEENIEEIISMPEYIAADFALRCKGDSMINARIFDGDVVYIRQQRTVNNGEIAAVLIGDEATLKRVRLSSDRMILMPENPTYDPLVFLGEEMNEVQIIGKAVAFTSDVK